MPYQPVSLSSGFDAIGQPAMLSDTFVSSISS